MSDTEFIIKCKMPERWVPSFLGMLDFMVHSGQIGTSRMIRFYSDGDGDFHPSFDWDTPIQPVGPAFYDGLDDPVFDAG